MLIKFILDIGKGIAVTFKGRNIFWHLFAIVSTYVLVMSGFDWWFFSVTRGETAMVLGMSAGMLGFFVPILVPLCMYVIGLMRKDVALKKIAAKSFVAVMVALIIIGAYKALTGRIEPEFLTSMAGIDNSRDFNFGFWRHGIFWGWPSSHTGVAFALSTFFAFLYREHKWLGIITILYALFIATGASVSFHWFSDAFAGIIVGSLAGYVIYKQVITGQT